MLQIVSPVHWVVTVMSLVYHSLLDSVIQVCYHHKHIITFIMKYVFYIISYLSYYYIIFIFQFIHL